GLVLGQYRILSHIGTGGMGTVYLCEHTSLRRRVALKVFRIDQTSEEGALARFYREARTAASLDHPNIVRAFDLNKIDKVHYLVLEYIEGRNLQQILAERGPLPYRDAVGYIAQAALGLQHAHDAGLVHRDIKPANLLVDKSGTVKILDMGLARSFVDPKDN